MAERRCSRLNEEIQMREGKIVGKKIEGGVHCGGVMSSNVRTFHDFKNGQEKDPGGHKGTL
jgi:hypothetical protein